MNRFQRWNRQHLFASVLTLALLFVQSVGLLHTIAHPGNQAGAHSAAARASQSASVDATSVDATSVEAASFEATSLHAQAQSVAADETGLFSLTHSCASFDAAALAAAVHVKAFETLFAIRAGVPPAAALPASHISLLRCEFNSRAPPVRLS